MDCDVAKLLAMTGLGSITTGLGAVTGAAGLRRRCAPRNDGVWDLGSHNDGHPHRTVERTGMAGLRRRCAPRNDGAGEHNYWGRRSNRGEKLGSQIKLT